MNFSYLCRVNSYQSLTDKPMKKLLFLFIAIFFCLMNINAQSTTDIYPQPERYVVMVHSQTSIYSVFLDSQTGIIKIISGWSHSSYVANGKDLTDGKPTKNGRFRLVSSNDNNLLVDTQEGRVWSFRISGKADKTEFKQMIPSQEGEND